MLMQSEQPGRKTWQNRLFVIIFESDTPAGKAFDVVLLFAIIVSILTVMLESVESINNVHGKLLRGVEWTFTILFTLEYVIRLVILRTPGRYARSFFGIVDFLAVIPTFLSLFLLNTQYFLVIRVVRLLRVFRIFKLGRYLNEGEIIVRALRASRPKITVFLGGVGTLIVIMGTMMYMIEGAESGFTSIPRSIYWAIVTLTTVGYGDIAPQTFTGQALASIVMILGYSIIAVPTGIVTVELGRLKQGRAGQYICVSCGAGDHEPVAVFCRMCGKKLEDRRQKTEDRRQETGDRR